MNADGVGQECESALDQLRPYVRLGCCQGKSVLVGGASAYVPEFHEILRHKAELITAGDEGVNSGSNDRVLGVRWIQQPQ